LGSPLADLLLGCPDEAQQLEKGTGAVEPMPSSHLHLSCPEPGPELAPQHVLCRYCGDLASLAELGNEVLKAVAPGRGSLPVFLLLTVELLQQGSVGHYSAINTLEASHDVLDLRTLAKVQ
jgi:hypothetical protein